MSPQPQRVQSLDLLRGFAVIVMVMGHSIDSVLGADARATDVFVIHTFLRGFTAPLFLFVSGISFMVATGKRWGEYTRISKPLLRRVLKMLFILVIGYALHLPFFSLRKLLAETTREELIQLLTVDVLQCVAVSILLMHVLVFLTRKRHTFAWVTGGLAAVIVIVAPFTERVEFAPVVGIVLAPYLNQIQQSVFPLIPYSAFLFSGAVVGHVFLRYQHQGLEGAFVRALFRACVIAAVVALLADIVPFGLFPPHDYWKTSPAFFSLRLVFVLLATCLFFALKNLPGWLDGQLAVLGRYSLLVYTVHLVVVFGSAANPGLRQIVGLNLSYPQAVGVGLAVLLAMRVMVFLWHHARTHHHGYARAFQVLLAGVLVLRFLTNPY
jgi:uncharacterized membrane protein